MAEQHASFADGALAARPRIRKITVADLRDALARGIDDFTAMPSPRSFCASSIHCRPAARRPDFGLYGAAAVLSAGDRLRAGGPLGWHRPLRAQSPTGARTGSISRACLRRDAFAIACRHRNPWRSAHGDLPALARHRESDLPIAVRPEAPASVTSFLHEVMTTPAGWKLIILGNGIGLLFAILVLATSVVSFPMLIDRKVDALTAVQTSVRAVIANPVTMAIWGLIVAALLAIGSLPLFVGLAVIMPCWAMRPGTSIARPWHSDSPNAGFVRLFRRARRRAAACIRSDRAAPPAASARPHDRARQRAVPQAAEALPGAG